MTPNAPRNDRRELDRAYDADVAHKDGGFEVRAG